MAQRITRRTEMIIIIGCARSGTGFISEKAKEIGLDIGHEKVGEHGIADWSQTTDGLFIDKQDGVFCHQVRNPLDTIASCTTLAGESWQFISKYIPIGDSLIHSCMIYWYYWNLLAEEKASHTYQLETFEPSNVNSRDHITLTWEDLKEIDSELTDKIIDLAKSYGYGY